MVCYCVFENQNELPHIVFKNVSEEDAIASFYRYLMYSIDPIIRFKKEYKLAAISNGKIIYTVEIVEKSKHLDQTTHYVLPKYNYQKLKNADYRFLIYYKCRFKPTAKLGYCTLNATDSYTIDNIPDLTFTHRYKAAEYLLQKRFIKSKKTCHFGIYLVDDIEPIHRFKSYNYWVAIQTLREFRRSINDIGCHKYKRVFLKDEQKNKILIVESSNHNTLVVYP